MPIENGPTCILLSAEGLKCMMRGLQDLGNHRLLMSGIGSDADAVSQSSDEVLLHLFRQSEAVHLVTCAAKQPVIGMQLASSLLSHWSS